MFLYGKRECKTQVVRCDAREDGSFDVVLEDTVLYAEGGGQPSDEGEIDGQAVQRLYRDEEGVTHHILGSPVAGVVRCTHDRHLRRRHSLLHSAQHLVSCVFDTVGSRTSSFHMDEGSFSIDLSGEHDAAQLNEMERIANGIIWDDLPIYARMYDPNRDADLVIPEGIEPETLRLVCIGRIDRNPCGGTHLENTGAIGLIKIMHAKPSRGGTRIWVTAGDEAIRWVQKVSDRDAAIRRIINVEEGKELAVLEDKLREHKKLGKEVKKLKKQLGDLLGPEGEKA